MGTSGNLCYDFLILGRLRCCAVSSQRLPRSVGFTQVMDPDISTTSTERIMNTLMRLETLRKKGVVLAYMLPTNGTTDPAKNTNIRAKEEVLGPRVTRQVS